jgi:hypothetical protein
MLAATGSGYLWKPAGPGQTQTNALARFGLNSRIVRPSLTVSGLIAMIRLVPGSAFRRCVYKNAYKSPGLWSNVERRVER